jgi:GalNAc-alpha-(1->4)-GalNAc-alpha-(1->3)-diNAcBac-PP-undecaprenol alpha-1,4-N-acetyl-D-galactosaminyltransferase
MNSDSNQEDSLSQPESASQPKGRLTFVIHKISAGGAERILTLLANELCDRGWSVTLLTLDSGIEPPFFELHPRIKHRPLSLMREQGSFWKAVKIHLLRPWLLRCAIRKSNPDAVISFIDLMNILTLVATVGLKTPVIISERGNPAFSMMGKLWVLLRKRFYKKASLLVVQTRAVLSYFPPSIQGKSRIIPNPVLVPDYTGPMERSGASPNTLMAMGRLSSEKGFDLLLKSFVPLSEKYPEWVLEVWGEGGQREFLESLCAELGLRERVRFPGLTKKHYKTMSQSDIFVLSSRNEGFPNVLGEAMACGLPVVSFDCPSGPAEMIQDGVNGLLVPPENIQELTSALERLMVSEELRKKIGKQARKISQYYSLDKIVQAWEVLIGELINEQKI